MTGATLAAENPRLPLLARLLPASLRSRLTLTILLANVSLMIVGVLVFLSFVSAGRPVQLESEARSTLQVAARDLETRLDLVDAVALTAAIAPGLVGRDSLGPDDIQQFRARLAAVAEGSDLDAIAIVSPGGDVVALLGETVGAETLESQLRAGDGPAVRGLIWLDGGTIGVVALRPLSEPHLGSLAVVKSVDPASIPSRYPIRFERTGVVFSGDRVIPGTGSPLFATTLLASSDDSAMARAELLGIDGRSAGWLTMDIQPDPVSSEVFGLSILVASGLAVIVSLVVGVGLTVLIRRPLDTLVTHVRRHGHAALEGHNVVALAADPLLPTELQNLAEVYDRLLDHLARRQAEVAEATSALQFAVNDSSEAKILLRDDRVALVNSAASTLLGLPLGHSSAGWDDALAELEFESEEGEPLTMSQAAKAARTEPTVVKVSAPGIPGRWMELRVVEHTDPQRTTLFTGRDVTEQRRVDAVREEIVSLVSHDLRAPLTVIGGYLDLLERPLPEESRSKAVAAARRSAERMTVLLEDLLTATRAEEFFSPVSLDPVSLAEIAEDTVFSFENASSHRLFASAGDPGMVLGEERRLRQVLVNLVTNAIKHAPEAGTIEVGVESRDGKVIASVQDDGPGIPAAERELVFERFARLAQNGENRPGIGLGLYIVRAIVESHGGTVHVEDRPDGLTGARFVIELPERDAGDRAGASQAG